MSPANASIEVREVPARDLDRIGWLSDIVFHEVSDEDTEPRWLWRCAQRIGAYDGGQLVGALTCLPRRISVLVRICPAPGSLSPGCCRPVADAAC